MQNNQETKFFDLHTKGIGYLNRIREVTLRKGQPFMAVTVAALRGSSDDVEYTYIDCVVRGAEAEKLIRRCQAASEAEKKIFVSFTIGDIYPDTFVYQSGKKKGETGVTLKGRLLRLGSIKIDGETVYQYQPDDASEEYLDSPEAPETSTAATEIASEAIEEPAA